LPEGNNAVSVNLREHVVPISRSPGLDLARTIAITGVLAAHAPIFLAPLGYGLADVISLYTWGGYYGVELFFALSGFLIGGILLRDVLPAPSPARLAFFFLRRWLRTLPAYYAVLLCFVAYALLKDNIPRSIGAYFLFFQNFPPELCAFFPVSWSLSIEQWAYALTPALLLAGLRDRRFFNRFPGDSVGARLIAVLTAAMCFFLVLRLGLALYRPDLLWDDIFRKQAPLRLDAILYGVLVAVVKVYYPAIFKRLASPVVFLACLALLQLFYSSFNGMLFRPGENIFLKSAAFSLVSALTAVSLCFFDAGGILRRACASTTRLGRFCLAGSKLAYSLYLVHMSVFSGFQRLAARHEQSAAVMLCAFFAAFLCSVGLAAALYACVEAPCMRLRRYFSLSRRPRSNPLREENGGAC
jgi:peptidoglycan/LPS O-acetylase OafA/YrhL